VDIIENVQLIKATIEDKSIVRNLLQFYRYDFSEFNQDDVQDDGLFPEYPYLEEYWNDPYHRHPYLVKCDNKYIGFVLVKYTASEQRNYFSIGEFFIVRKYRRKGLGRVVATQIFDAHRGEWEVHQIKTNHPAQIFWNTVIREYTRGDFSERWEGEKRIQTFTN
jgi:predicted acetyltransferase